MAEVIRLVKDLTSWLLLRHFKNQFYSSRLRKDLKAESFKTTYLSPPPRLFSVTRRPMFCFMSYARIFFFTRILSKLY